MKPPIWKLLIIAGCLMSPWHAKAGAEDKYPNPFADGLIPIFHTASEEEELRHYINGQRSELEISLDLAKATCGDGGSDKKIDCRIGVYLDHIRKVIPETVDKPWDLQNFTGTLLRISLNQAVFIEQKMRELSYWTHEFREKDMLFGINTAIELYKNDVELFKSKADREVEYMRYATKFARFVKERAFILRKKEAIEYYFFASQLLLNVIEAKGNTHQNLFAEEIQSLKDIHEKTDPKYTGIFKDRGQQVRYAETRFENMFRALEPKFAEFEKRIANEAAERDARRAASDLEAAIDSARSPEEAYLAGIVKHPESILAYAFQPGKRVRGEYDQFFFTYVGTVTKEPKKGFLICAFNPIIPSGVYLDGQYSPWSKIGAGCIDDYPHGKDDNANGATLSWPYKDRYIITKKGEATSFEVFDWNR